MKKFGIVIMIVSLALVFPIQRVNAQNLVIKYGYRGQFGMYRIADTASAFIDSKLIAYAHALKIIEQSSGPNHILIKEEQYDSYGRVIYQGTLEFEFGWGGGTLVEETRISGKKRYNVFTSWPSG